MRWLLLFLIVLNAVVLFWFGQQQKTEIQHDAGMASASTSQAPGIALLSELPRNKIKFKKAEPEPKEPEPPVASEPVPPGPATVSAEAPSDKSAPAAVAAGEPVESPAAPADDKKPVEPKPVVAAAKPVSKDACGFLGPFAEPITVRQVASRLKRARAESKIYSESIAISPVYWVYLRPAKSRADALANLRELQSARIESFLVSEGADLNAVSLGYYKKKESAEAIQKQRIEQGYDAKMVKKERKRDQYWVVVAPQGWSQVDASLVAELRKEYGEFTRRSRKCAFVASYTHFE